MLYLSIFFVNIVSKLRLLINKLLMNYHFRIKKPMNLHKNQYKINFIHKKRLYIVRFTMIMRLVIFVSIVYKNVFVLNVYIDIL